MFFCLSSFSHTHVPNLRCILLAEVSTKIWLTVDLLYACGMVLKYIYVCACVRACVRVCVCVQGMLGKKLFSPHKQTSLSLLSISRYKYSSDIVIIVSVIDVIIIIIIIIVGVERDY
jgi:hypothetical protein